MIIFKNITDHINTWDAHSKGTFRSGHDLIIPYINLELMENNPISSNTCVIDFSYLVFREVQEMQEGEKGNSIYFQGKPSASVNPLLLNEYVIINSWRDSTEIELKISCHTIDLYVNDDFNFRSREHPFVPYDTPKWKANMDNEKIERFFLRESFDHVLKYLK
ncbi:hypothetical protein CLV59_105483 [Chitinophaga dinghuensis]|uniref:Uncharacterized protein n=1 Tax=Chitinophaga dinghuensis TaxID=1539050 RepID=A0A327W045_9BACT|nr:hypothetical protein CLV59_105483 [Chitinophaga dinghuensis]